MPNSFSGSTSAVLLIGCIISGTLGQDDTQDYFAPLKDIPPVSNSVGGQSFSRCCLQALQDWKDGDRHDVTVYDRKDPNSFFDSPEKLAASKQQFPCGAEYEDDNNGAATVFITYDYCSSKCGGWQRSHNHPLTQWIQPFVGFILPAAVFCLNVCFTGYSTTRDAMLTAR